MQHKPTTTKGLNLLLETIESMHKGARQYAARPNCNPKSLTAMNYRLEQLTEAFNTLEAEITDLTAKNSQLAAEAIAAAKYSSSKPKSPEPNPCPTLNRFWEVIQTNQSSSDPNARELAREASKARARIVWPELYEPYITPQKKPPNTPKIVGLSTQVSTDKS